MEQDFSTVVIIGGSSGIGLATAQAAYRKGLRPTIIGRDGAKLASAIELIGPPAASAVTDASDRAALDRTFASIGTFDQLVIAASGGAGLGYSLACPLKIFETVLKVNSGHTGTALRLRLAILLRVDQSRWSRERRLASLVQGYQVWRQSTGRWNEWFRRLQANSRRSG